MTRNIWSGLPTNVVIEASFEVICEQNLNTLDGEQYDHINNVISVNDDGENITFTTVRSIEAFKRGEPNAGRAVWTFAHGMIDCIMIDGQAVWGTPTFRQYA